jgi:hypothetical protein
VSGLSLSYGSRPRRRAPFDPSTLSGIIGAILDPAHASTVVTGLGVSSLADELGGSPAVQSTDGLRPPRVSATNGELVLQGVNDVLMWPASSANNQLVTWGWCGHLLLDNLTASKYLLRYGPGGSTDPVATDSHNLRVLGDESLFLQVFTDATGGQARNASMAGGALDSTSYKFVTLEMNLALVGEANQVVITVEAAVQALNFANSIGAPGAMPAALQGQPGGSDIMLLNNRTNANLAPCIGKLGRQYILKAAMPGVTRGLLTTAAREYLRQLRRPVA